MSEPARSWLPLSTYRRCLLELLRQCRNIPLVTAERPMRLADVVAARQASLLRPAWTTIFAKAFAIVAARRPELRRSFIRFPWVHLHEHPVNVASVIVERVVDGEEMPLNHRFREPERHSLAELQSSLLRAKTRPIEEVPIYRRMRKIARLPGPLRRLLWMMAYHLSGKVRAKNYGTFALSSPAACGAGLTTIISPVALTLHYGMFEDDGRINMRLTFDHRAIDGAPAARALVDMEAALHSEILVELRQLPSVGRAA
jgi:hypothetical protein